MAEPPFAGFRVTAAVGAARGVLIGAMVPIPPVGKLAVLAARPPRPCRVLDDVAPLSWAHAKSGRRSRPLNGVRSTLPMTAKSSPRKKPSPTPVDRSSIAAYVRLILIFGVNAIDTNTPGKSPVARAESLCVTVNGCAPRRMMEPAGAHGSANSVYAHLTSREAGMSVLMSAARNVPLLWPTAPVVGAPKPASVEQRKDTSFPFGHVAPHV